MSNCSPVLRFRLIKAWNVEYFRQKPNYKSSMTVLISRKLKRRLYAGLLCILPILDSKDIDL